LVLLAVVATGCGGIQASKSISPIDFLLPGLHLQNCPPSPVTPDDTNPVPLLAHANPVPLSVCPPATEPKTDDRLLMTDYRSLITDH
jgi:hypothetical protein